MPPDFIRQGTAQLLLFCLSRLGQAQLMDHGTSASDAPAGPDNVSTGKVDGRA